MLAVPSIYVFITKYCLNLKIQGFFHNPFKNKVFFSKLLLHLFCITSGHWSIY